MKKGSSSFDSDYVGHLLAKTTEVAAAIEAGPMGLSELHSNLNVGEAIRLICEAPPDRTGDQFLKRELLYRLS